MRARFDIQKNRSKLPSKSRFCRQYPSSVYYMYVHDVCVQFVLMSPFIICPVIAQFEHRVMSFVMFTMISITGPIDARHVIGSFCSSLLSCGYFQRPPRCTESWNPYLKQRPDILLSLHKQAGYLIYPDSEMSWMF